MGLGGRWSYRGKRSEQMAFEGWRGEVSRSVRVEDGEVITGQDFRMGEDALSGFTSDDVVGATGVDVEGNRTMSGIDGGSVDDLA